MLRKEVSMDRKDVKRAYKNYVRFLDKRPSISFDNYRRMFPRT